MGQWILTSSVLIIVAIVLRLVFKEYVGLRFRYSLWLVVLLRLLIPFGLFDSGISVANAIQRVNERWLIISEERLEDTYTNESKQEGIGPLFSVHTVSPDTISKIALTVWMMGMTLIGVVFFISNVRFRLRLRRSRVSFDPICLKTGDIKLPIYVSGAIGTPCLVGVFRPAIYLTEEVTVNRSVLMCVLEHEYTHYRHGDHIWSLLRCMCLTIHWFNPLVWKAGMLSRLDSELACDEATVKKLGEEKRFDYGSVIIELSSPESVNLYRSLTIAETMAVKESNLKERIICLTKKPRTTFWMGSILLLILLASAFAAFTKDEHAGQTISGHNPDSELTMSGDLVSYYADNGEITRQYEIDAGIVMEHIQVGLAYFDLSQGNAPVDRNGERIVIALGDGSDDMVFYLEEPDLFCRQNGETVTYWKAIARSETESRLFVKTIGEWVFRIFSDLDKAAQHITFSAQGDAYSIGEEFVQHIYRNYYLNRMAGSYHSATDYQVFEWRIEENSEDGTKILGFINYGVKPEDPTPRTASFWSGGGSDGKDQYKGWRIYSEQFLLTLQENGEWNWEIGFFGSGRVR